MPTSRSCTKIHVPCGKCQKVFATLQSTLEHVQSELEHSRVEIERMKRQLDTDHLTGLQSRRSFEARLPQELELNRQKGSTHLSLAIIDLDLFKPVNDTYGHLIGDEVLKKFSEILRGNVRVTDYVARLGGEEFGLILPDTAVEHAERFLNRLREAIERNLIVKLKGRTVIRKTASFGVVEWDGRETPSDLLRRADGALRKAKDAGRNQVIRA